MECVVQYTGHPEFPSAHAVFGTAVATMLTDVLGDIFNLHYIQYDYLGLPARNYNSFFEMSKEMADSRVFAGIPTRHHVIRKVVRRKSGKNVLEKVKFLKE
jgi:hypothetical protein